VGTIEAYLKFAYGCFLKPHTGDGSGSQQDALVGRDIFSKVTRADHLQESFYKAQADVYDATRVRLLCGREDMLGLVAAQLKHRAEAGLITQRPVWVDVCMRTTLENQFADNNRLVAAPVTSNCHKRLQHPFSNNMPVSSR
jgi:hypothetical protein